MCDGNSIFPQSACLFSLAQLPAFQRQAWWEYILSLLAQLITYLFFIQRHKGKGIYATILICVFFHR